MHAIVLDGHIKSALTTIRSLGVHGVTVSVGAVRKTAMGLHSKYTKDSFMYPSPYEDEAGFVEAVRGAAKRLGNMPIVYAFSDVTFLALYAHRASLSEVCTLVFPPDQSVEIAFDKAATYSLARVSGIPTIPTHIPDSNEKLRMLAKELTYPAVVKTRRSVTRHNGVGIFGTAQFVQNAEELVRTYIDIRERVGEAPLIQPYMQGEEYGVEMLVDGGHIYARVVHHRIRSLSPTGGASVLKETVSDGELRHTLISYAETLVKKLEWTGPIMVEFRVDADTRIPYLMEINGRFWGSLPLAVHAGVDVPSLYYDAVAKHDVPDHVVEGREDVRSVHFLGDVLHLIRVLFARDPMRKIAYPKRLGAVRNFLFTPVGTKSDVWSWSDPKPGYMEMVDMIQSKIRK